jgi:hypothetical protein
MDARSFVEALRARGMGVRTEHRRVLVEPDDGLTAGHHRSPGVGGCGFDGAAGPWCDERPGRPIGHALRTAHCSHRDACRGVADGPPGLLDIHRGYSGRPWLILLKRLKVPTEEPNFETVLASLATLAGVDVRSPAATDPGFASEVCRGESAVRSRRLWRSRGAERRCRSKATGRSIKMAGVPRPEGRPPRL